MYLSVPPTNSLISSVYAVQTRAASVSLTTDSEVEFLPTSTSVALPPFRSSFFPISNPDIFFSYLFGSSSRWDAYSSFCKLRDSIPPSPTNLYTPIQLACMWLTEQFTQDPFIDLAPTGEVNLPKTTYAYKKVADKTKPVATTLTCSHSGEYLNHPIHSVHISISSPTTNILSRLRRDPSRTTPLTTIRYNLSTGQPTSLSIPNPLLPLTSVAQALQSTPKAF